jgi:AraC-like DNA-binding protein
MTSLVRRIANDDAFTLSVVACGEDQGDWAQAPQCDDCRMVLLRRGRARRRTHAVNAELDRTVGYIAAPLQEEHFAYPQGGVTVTWLSLHPEAWPPMSDGVFYVDARLELAHRRLISSATSGDLRFNAVEAVTQLLSMATREATLTSHTSHDRRLVDQAREAITARDPAAAGLMPLARMLKTSPYALSRAFTRELGVSVTRYRNRVRVGQALDRLTNGEVRLADLAAQLGFADQAHLTRTVREHLGYTPAVLRHMRLG